MANKEMQWNDVHKFWIIYRKNGRRDENTERVKEETISSNKEKGGKSRNVMTTLHKNASI